MNNTEKSVLCVAGEPSGDEHAASVLRNLKKEAPGIKCFGIGGPRMKAQGFEQVLPFEPFNRMGLTEVLTGIGFFIKAKNYLARLMDERKPSVCLLVDYSGFNIPVMKTAKKKGVPVVWYITPKVWAWKPKRAEIIGKYADNICTILPFEKELFKKFNKNVDYVGNPLVESLGLYGEKKEENCVDSEKKNGEVKLALVPGSRKQEVERMLGVMAEAVSILKKDIKDLTVKVSYCEWLDESLYKRYTEKNNISIFSGSLDELLKWADFAFVTSGTATLHAALREKPFILVYKTGILNYIAAKIVVKLKYIGLPNIIAGREVVPELVQNNASPDNLARYAGKYLFSEKEYRRFVSELSRIREIFGRTYPGNRVAKLLCSYFR